MAKRKKQSKVQKRGKLRRENSAKRGKARKVAKAAKRTVARAKPKHAPVKEVARKVKQPVAPLVETVAVELIEQPAPSVITVTEVEETEVLKASSMPANGTFKPAPLAVAADLPSQEAGCSTPPGPESQPTRPLWRSRAGAQRFDSTSLSAWPRPAAQGLAVVANLVAREACRRVGALFASHLHAGSHRRGYDNADSGIRFCGNKALNPPTALRPLGSIPGSQPDRRDGQECNQPAIAPLGPMPFGLALFFQ